MADLVDWCEVLEDAAEACAGIAARGGWTRAPAVYERAVPLLRALADRLPMLEAAQAVLEEWERYYGLRQSCGPPGIFKAKWSFFGLLEAWGDTRAALAASEGGGDG